MRLAIFPVLCAVCQVPLPSLADSSPPQAATISSDQVRQWLRVESDWEADAATALAGARMRLDAALRRWLSAERPSLGDGFLRAEALTRLLSRPDVLWRQNAERRERAYGTMWRVRIEVGLAQATIDNWMHEIGVQARHQRDCVLGKLGLSVIALLLAGLLVGVLDRWTRGYRRAAAVSSGGALAVILMAVVWAY